MSIELYAQMYRAFEYKEKLQSFDCGEFDINRFIREDVEKSDQGITTTGLIVNQVDDVIGFFSLHAAQIEVEDPEADMKTTNTFPCVNLAYLAIDKKYQGKGCGKIVLSYIFRKVFELYSFLGIAAITLQSYHDSASFYLDNGFREVIPNLFESNENELHNPRLQHQLFITVDDILDSIINEEIQ